MLCQSGVLDASADGLGNHRASPQSSPSHGSSVRSGMYSMSPGRLRITKVSTPSSALWSSPAGGPDGKSRGPSFEFHAEGQYGVAAGFRSAKRFPDGRSGTPFKFPLKIGMFSSQCSRRSRTSLRVSARGVSIKDSAARSAARTRFRAARNKKWWSAWFRHICCPAGWLDWRPKLIISAREASHCSSWRRVVMVQNNNCRSTINPSKY
jgi:hypothetical protein